jgi:hypothetical protein
VAFGNSLVIGSIDKGMSYRIIYSAIIGDDPRVFDAGNAPMN